MGMTHDESIKKQEQELINQMLESYQTYKLARLLWMENATLLNLLHGYSAEYIRKLMADTK